MTAQNWLMISPMLLLLLVAVALIPVVTKANKKYAKLVAVQRRKRNEAAHGINAESIGESVSPYFYTAATYKPAQTTSDEEAINPGLPPVGIFTGAFELLETETERMRSTVGHRPSTKENT
ncbi:hypothetical protein [Vreelandella sulfidaeris]